MSARAAALRERIAAPSRHLHIVKRRSKKRSLIKRTRQTRLVVVVIISAIATIAVVVGVLLEQVFLAQSAFKLTDLRKSYEAADDRHEELLLQSAQLDSAARIERYARTTLGMVDPAPDQIQYIVARVGQPSQVASVRSGHTGANASGVAAGETYSEGP